MNGIIYLLDQAGIGLQQAAQQIAELRQENEALRAQLAERADPASS